MGQMTNLFDVESKQARCVKGNVDLAWQQLTLLGLKSLLKLALSACSRYSQTVHNSIVNVISVLNKRIYNGIGIYWFGSHDFLFTCTQ